MNAPARNRLTLLFGALPLLLAGGDHVSRGAQVLGVLVIGGALLNLLGVLLHERLPQRSLVIISVMNAVLALITAYAYHLADQPGLPYVWLTAGVLYAYAAYQFYRRASRPER